MIWELKMPRLDEDMLEGTLTRWLKKEGDLIQKGEVVLEIETQKVNFQVEAPGTGYLQVILAGEGDLVPINGLLGVVGEPEDDLSAYRKIREEKRRGKEGKEPAGEPVKFAAGPQAREEGRILISPVARKIARERSLDISQIRGTGPEGRITKEDVLNFRPAEKEKSGKHRRQIRQTLPLSGIRKTIADRMLESWHNAPRAENHMSADVSVFLDLREKQGEEWEKKFGIRPTIHDVVISAAAGALKTFPMVNSAVRDGRIEMYEEINVSMAVSLEGGLITPVIPQADRKGIFEIAREARRLAELVRSGKHGLEVLSGSTFTITNLGMYDVEFFVPVINPPESAILSLGKIEKKPVVISDAIAIRSIMRLCLAYDHRVLDGALAARFLSQVKRDLEDCKPLFSRPG